MGRSSAGQAASKVAAKKATAEDPKDRPFGGSVCFFKCSFGEKLVLLKGFLFFLRDFQRVLLISRFVYMVFLGLI